MKFRLTYDGELRPTQGEARDQQRNPLAHHKHEIRRHFHKQLKHLWKTNKFLKEHKQHIENRTNQRPIANSLDSLEWFNGEHIALAEAVARNYREFGYRFVPLVRREISLLCSLDILFLRRDIPGSAISAGDIDNRIKTLIDTLRRPRSPNELTEAHSRPSEGEDPFFCLLEDDDQVSQFSVETDTLLDPPDGRDGDNSQARIVVTVELRPYHVTMFNLSFA